jgi:hypothetical protein
MIDGRMWKYETGSGQVSSLTIYLNFILHKYEEVMYELSIYYVRFVMN